MTTRQRTTANILLGIFAAAMIAAAIVSWRMYDATTAAASERADVTASELADLRTQLDQQATTLDEVTAQRDDARDRLAKARDQRDAARDQRDETAATLTGQYDVNADQATQIADLKARLSDAKDAATKAPAAPEPRFYEDGSWVAGKASGCAPSALCDDAYQDSLIEHVPSGLATWEGFRVGEVILCPKGWTIADDTTEDGQTWAACQ